MRRRPAVLLVLQSRLRPDVSAIQQVEAEQSWTAVGPNVNLRNSKARIIKRVRQRTAGASEVIGTRRIDRTSVRHDETLDGAVPIGNRVQCAGLRQSCLIALALSFLGVFQVKAAVIVLVQDIVRWERNR